MIKSNNHLVEKEDLEHKGGDFVIPLVISIAIHFVIAYLFFFGAPIIFKPLPEKQIIITEVVAISTATNIKPKQAITEESKNEATASEKDIPKSKLEEVKEDNKSKDVQNPIEEKKTEEVIHKKEEEKKKEKKEEKKT